MKKYIAVLTIAIVAGALGFGVAAAGGGDNTTGSGKPVAAPGGRGPAKADSQVQFAVVAGDGTKARSYPSNVTVVYDSTGTYNVLFPRNVKPCAFTATQGTTSVGTAPDGTATTARLATSKKGVWVNTYNTAGNLEDRSFHLTVTCPPL
jgi:hypothetical protein